MTFSKDYRIIRNLLLSQGVAHNLTLYMAHEREVFDILTFEEGGEFTPEMEGEAIIDFFYYIQDVGVI